MDEKDKLKEAVKLVNEAIAKKRQELEKMLDEDTRDDLVEVEGETCTGYIVRSLVEPQRVARILLDHDYPIYFVLGEDFQESMWHDLADEMGLESVFSVDV